MPEARVCPECGKDLSSDAVARDVSMFRDASAALSQVDLDLLDPAEQVDHAMLTSVVERLLFERTQVREHEWNPLVHNPGDLIERLIDWSWRPLRHQGPFDYGDGQILREGVEIFREMTQKRYTRGEPLCVLSARMFFGIFAMLYRLRARVNWRAIGEEEARAAGEPLPER